MRMTRLLFPTLKEVPRDAVIPSHILMLRAGLIRKLGSGFYTYLPLGLRILKKIENIIREEMDKIGAQEVLFPILIPKELWEESGRWDAFRKELFRLQDRHENHYALGPTHEESVTDLFRREYTSYREMPVVIYQMAVKFRDEIRPRFGVMRSREFIMKDAYSFHLTEECLDKTYNDMSIAYQAIFKRLGLKTLSVRADTGAMGGSGSEEFMVENETGEEIIVFCRSCSYAANIEKAETVLQQPDVSAAAETSALEETATPGVRTIEELENFLKLPKMSFIKSLIYKNPDSGSLVMALIRGDREINEKKLAGALGWAEITLAGDNEILEVTGAPAGFAGPCLLKKKVEIIADLSVKEMRNAVSGANKKDTHYKNIKFGRDFTPDRIADINKAHSGDACPSCRQKLFESRGVEVGHIFKLGDKYTKAFGVKIADNNSSEKIPIMGCYGIGVNRSLAAVIEQNHDENGIIFPPQIAPYQAGIISVNAADSRVFAVSEEIYNILQKEDIEALWDDRDIRAGIKFKDADLAGIPVKIIISEKALGSGQIEIKIRKTGETRMVKKEEIASVTKAILAELEDAQQ